MKSGTLVIKGIGIFILALGLLLLVFSVLAYMELRTAATSSIAPEVDEMPLTQIVAPEFLDPGSAKKEPAKLASAAFNRIYMIGGVAVLMTIIGVLLVVLRLTPKRLPTDSAKLDSEPSN